MSLSVVEILSYSNEAFEYIADLGCSSGDGGGISSQQGLGSQRGAWDVKGSKAEGEKRLGSR